MSLVRFRNSAFARALSLVSAVWLAGCYAYTPAAGTPAPGAEVRARLTAEAAVRETERMGTVTQWYSGRLMDVRGDSIALSVVSARAASGVGATTMRQIYTIPLGDVSGFEQREMSVWRTALVAALAAGAVAGMVGGIMAGGNTGETGGPGNEAFGPGLRIPIPR